MNDYIALFGGIMVLVGLGTMLSPPITSDGKIWPALLLSIIYIAIGASLVHFFIKTN